MINFFKTKFSVICSICLVICLVGGFTNTNGSNISSSEDSVSTASASVSTDNDTMGSITPEAGNDGSVANTNISIYVNGILISDGIKVNGSTYIPLRTFFEAIGVQADVSWDSKTNTAVVSGAGLSLTAVVGDKYFTANSRCFYVPDGVINVNGSVALPIRELAKVYKINVGWDTDSSSISICADKPQLLDSASTVYKEKDLYWLSRLINAEAGNQSLEGKIAVGDVVINRLSDPECPDTIYGIIFDNKFGTQFSVTETGGIYEAPNEESIVAAKLCLEGYDIVGKSIYFVNPTTGSTAWFNKTRVFVASVGAHNFYE
jgi:N-acetylmuramoyl-L-alanine amidase